MRIKHRKYDERLRTGRRRGRRRTLAAVAVLGILAAGCGSTKTASNNSAATAKTTGCKVNLTFWSWVPNISSAVALYNQTHPGVCVHADNVGSGNAELQKLVNAVKAGTGAPDIVQTGYIVLYQFVAMHGLVDMSKYGANAVKSDFPTGAWQAGEVNGQLYGMPQDNSPAVLMYNNTLVKKYHLAIPTTWTQLVTEAKQLHAEAPGVYLTGFDTNAGEGLLADLNQVGVKPFALSGHTLTIALNTQQAREYASVWDQLLAAHAVDVVPSYTTQFWDALSKGKMVMWPTPAWMPGLFSSLAGKTLGSWRVAPLPQFPGSTVNPNPGGSTTSVTTQSTHPAQATQFAIWLNTNEAVWQKVLTKPPSGLYPMDVHIVNQPWFLDQTIPLTGSQQLEKVFAAAGEDPSMASVFPPFGVYVSGEIGNMLDTVGSGKETLAQGLQALQSNFVSYAKQQGFTVNAK